MKLRFNLLIITYILIVTNICLSHIQSLTVQTIYGNFMVTEPVLIELFNHPIMERIKHIKQYGVADYVIKQKRSYTRYEHCVGVWALLRMYGASLEEQIAGLLHDASHTVFSHVGDVLFKHHATDSSYQDGIHEWYLKHYAIDSLVEQHNISFDSILPKNGNHTMLEQPLPNICADRLEYNLQAGLLTDMLTMEDIPTILNDLRYNNDTWFFINEENAHKLALVSLYNTEHVWGSLADQFIYDCTAEALSRALMIGLLTMDDIHFSTDAIIWDKLWISNDEVIIECLTKIINFKTELAITKRNKSITPRKFRGLDPLVLNNNQLKKLTDINPEYRQKYDLVKIILFKVKNSFIN